jgi:phosphoribosylglycinamide formyltransferase-1
MSVVKSKMSASFSIVVLISGSGSNLQSIIDAITAGKISARVSAVISNKVGVYGLERAEQHGIPTEVIEHTQFENREIFDQQLQSRIDYYQADLVVLAGFMRILTAPFVQHYYGRMLNIHPSLLPKYKGINTHQRALDDNAKQHGVSVHFVTPELDGGPVIAQASIMVEADDTAQSLAKRVLKYEHRIFPTVIQWFVEQRLSLSQQGIVFDNQVLKNIIAYV